MVELATGKYPYPKDSNLFSMLTHIVRGELPSKSCSLLCSLSLSLMSRSTQSRFHKVSVLRRLCRLPRPMVSHDPSCHNTNSLFSLQKDPKGRSTLEALLVGSCYHKGSWCRCRSMTLFADAQATRWTWVFGCRNMWTCRPYDSSKKTVPDSAASMGTTV